MGLQDIIETVFTFENALILTPIIIYLYLFLQIILPFILDSNPLIIGFILFYLIIVTSININFHNRIGKIENDPNKEYLRSISKSVSATILSLSIISLIIFLIKFTPPGRTLLQTRMYYNTGKNIYNSIVPSAPSA